MTRSPNEFSLRWINLTLGIVAMLVILAFSLTQTETFSPGQVLIVGDSITELPAIGGNHGNKGWWQYLLDGKKGMFKLSAESGSGYIAQGSRGMTFYDRLPDIPKLKPKIIIIAGGVNDRNVSHPDASIKKYYDALSSILKKNRIPLKNVYVFVPHPAGVASNITALVKSNAKRVGVRFIEIPGYTATYDGIHPDSSGAKTIEQSLAKNSDLDEHLK